MKRAQRLWREWGSSVAFALLVTQFGASAVRVDGASMLPGLRHGELLLLPKAEGWAHRLGLGAYQRGDIVVFKPPPSAAYEWKNNYRGLPLLWRYRPYLVKRVVGVAGDVVQVKAGKLLVNGQNVPEQRTLNYWDKFCHDTHSSLANTAPQKVLPGEYFVMGDNRSEGGSLDSRVFGTVKGWDIDSRAVGTLWPVFRKSDMVPGCNPTDTQPEQHTHTRGEVVLGWRWLERGER